MRSSSCYLVVALICAACGSQSTRSDPAAPAPLPAPEEAREGSGARLVIGAMRLVISLPDETPKTVELAPDGKITRADDGKVVGQIVDDEIRDADGMWIVRVHAGGKVDMRSVTRETENGVVVRETENVQAIGTFSETDAIHGEKGVATLSDDGIVSVQRPDGTTERFGEIRVEGVTNDTRRAGLLLFVAVMAGGTTTIGWGEAAPALGE